MILDEILSFGKKIDASDAHLICGYPPRFRVNKKLVPQKDGQILTKEDLTAILNETKNPIYLDKDGSKFKLSANKSNDNLSLHIRFLNPLLKPGQLGLPRVVSEFSSYKDGIIIISGPSNSGRSTTASSIIKEICNTKKINLATLKQSEYLEEGVKFKNPDDIVSQDIDVCFLEDLEGEIFKMAVSGKLVVATVLNDSTLGLISSLVKCPYQGYNKQKDQTNSFLSIQFLNSYANDESYRAYLLSQHLRAIINQRLLPGIDGKMKLVYEILLPTPEIRKSIKNMDLDAIPNLIKRNQAKDGIVSMNQSILSLLTKRKIELNDAFETTQDLEDLESLLKQAGI